MNPITTRDRERRLRAIACQIIKHGYSASEVAHVLARTALEYAERDLGDAARALGLPPEAIARVLSNAEAAQAIERGVAAAKDDWDSGQAMWPADGSHD